MEESMQCPQCGACGPYWVSASGGVKCAKCYHVVSVMTIDPTPQQAEAGEDEGEGYEPLGLQISRLAKAIIELDCGEPSQSEGAVDCAIRLLRAWRPAPPASAPEGDGA